ncbi:MAG: endonuclease/exonuclease/phosphatase family protein [Myxococcota bacterium]|nr:endonuclease/exonuclease/phosphatase family protein [Myxococcota bacterium]
MRGERDAGLLVATYNVHGFVGRDGARDPKRVAQVLEEIDGDVMALQEVVAEADAVEELARSLGAEAVMGPTLERHAGPFGNVLLSRLPIRSVRRLDLSVSGREPRGAIDCVLQAGTTPLRVVATHLGLQARERRVQVRRLATELTRPGPPVLVLLGDMNEWRRRLGSLATLRSLLGPSTQPRSFPAWRPALPLDRIWTRPRALLRRAGVHRSRLARQASDHLPVYAEIALRMPPTPL